MKLRSSPLLVLLGMLQSFSVLSQSKVPKPKPIQDITIQWVDSLAGDFGFVNLWRYAEGIIKNTSGKVVCNANCPPRMEKMMDAKGGIYKDSLRAYYKLIDTTHYYYTIQADAWCYEYFGSNYITCFKNTNGFINCYTLNNAATHSSLRLSLFDDKCSPSIHLTSIISGGNKIFKCSSGSIKIDKSKMAQGFLKAEFDFKFINTTDASKPIYWKGKIFCQINEM